MRKIADIINIVDSQESWKKYREDIMVFLSEKLKISVLEVKIRSDRPISEVVYQNIMAGIHQIVAGVPLYRILGYRYFWKDRFVLSKDTLEPRPDTEVVIETVLRYCEDSGAALKVLDVGTGTGCILLSLLQEFPKAEGFGVDVASGALETAARNANALGLSDRANWVQSDWLEKVEGGFDVIVSNPPYIPTSDISELSEVVQAYDPMRALDGGEDGLDPYRILAQQLPKVLNPNSLIVLEIGYDQAESVPSVFMSAGYEVVEIVRDYGKNPRCVVVRAGKVGLATGK